MIFKKKESTQELLGIEAITDYGISTKQGELVFFSVAPTNLSVLPADSIDARINALLNIIKGFIQCFQQQFHLRIFIISKSVWNECLYVKEGHVHNRTRPSFIISLTSVLIIWTELHRMQRPCPSLRSGHSTPEQLEAYRLNPGPSTQTSLRCLLRKQSS